MIEREREERKRGERGGKRRQHNKWRERERDEVEGETRRKWERGKERG
jgi:hypothetical protein